MEKTGKKLLVVALLSTLILGIAGCSGSKAQPEQKAPAAPVPNSAPAQPEFKLKFGHDQAPEHAYHLAGKFLADKVKERTNGRVQIDVFPNAQLGAEQQMLDSLKMGTLDFSISSTSNASSHIPQMGLLSASYLFTGKDHIYKVATDPIIVAKYTKLVEDKKPGFKLVTFMPNAARSMYSTQEIKSVDDVQGMKVRVMASPVETKVWTAIGTKPTTVPFSEVYTALQTKMVVAAENTPSSYYTAKHNEVAPFFIQTEHQWMMTQVWISEKTWNKLPADIQKIVMETGKEMAKYGLDAQVANDQKALDEAVSKSGIKVVKVDQKAFAAKVTPLHDGIAKETGAEDVLARIRELAK